MRKLIVLIASLLFIPLIITSCGGSTTTERLENEFGIDLPENMEIEYHYHAKPGVGRVEEFIVFKVEGDPMEQIDNSDFISRQRYGPDYSGIYSPFSEGRDSSFEKRFENLVNVFAKCYLESHNKYCDHLDIPEEYYPDWENRYFFAGWPAGSPDTGMDKFFIIYFSETSRLVLFMGGH